MDTPRHVLFIEDDPEIGNLVCEELREHGCEVDWHRTGTDGWAHFQREDPALVVLDLRLPATDGMDVLRRIRETDPHVPVVILSAKAEKRDVVRGLELGADDYVTKPFSSSELIARIEALLRRVEAERDRHAQEEVEEIRVGPLTIYPKQHRAQMAGDPVDLTSKEFDLLLQFAQHPGRAFSRGELLNRVWGEEFDGFDHTVNTHINRLRDKIEPDSDDPTLIQTVWGVGYRFADPQELATS
ncbi:MAG: response regulator transcription factor [Salinibacter sp.]|uniref:response regulator transcription factor n=1 Tax=Salinibacter sp. TaxID=2065818 RepID=UPI0035D4A65D